MIEEAISIKNSVQSILYHYQIFSDDCIVKKVKLLFSIVVNFLHAFFVKIT